MAKNKLQSVQRAYVDKALERTGWSLSELARHCGKSNTTLTRFMNSPDHKSLLSLATLIAIAEASGVPLPPELGSGRDGSDKSERHLTRAEEAEIMRLVVERVDELQKTKGVKLTNAKRNQIVVLVYQDILSLAKNDPSLVRAGDIDADKVLQLIELAR